MEDLAPLVSIVTILGAPFLPGGSLALVDNFAVRFLLVLWVAYSVRVDALPGCLALLAAFTLLIERNQEVLTKFPNQNPRWPTTAMGVPIQAPSLMPTHEVIEAPHPETEGVRVVEERAGEEVEKEYEHANDLHDNNPRLKEAPLSDDAPDFYKGKGLA